MPPDVSIKTPVAIVGGGLSGLTLARLLLRRGIDFVLLEAQPCLGGRIRSLPADRPDAAQNEGRYDLGPTWFWPETQPILAAFVQELGIDVFPQYASGDMLYEDMPGKAPRRFPGYQMSPASMRIAGGVQTLIETIAAQLPPERLLTGRAVRQLMLSTQGVQLDAVDLHGQERALEASQVVLALPPRLIAATLGFSPQLPPETLALWANTPTWMAGHAKLVAVYDEAFWRSGGLSGSAQSRVGPLGEIHDASDMSGNAALFGFFGLAASTRLARGQEELTSAAIAQLVRIFGEQAGSPKAVYFQDWAAEPYVATERDWISVAQHPDYGSVGKLGSAWQDRSRHRGLAPQRRLSGRCYRRGHDRRGLV